MCRLDSNGWGDQKQTLLSIPSSDILAPATIFRLKLCWSTWKWHCQKKKKLYFKSKSLTFSYEDNQLFLFFFKRFDVTVKHYKTRAHIDLQWRPDYVGSSLLFSVFFFSSHAGCSQILPESNGGCCAAYKCKGAGTKIKRHEKTRCGR